MRLNLVFGLTTQLHLLAQAAAPPEKITPGSAIAGFMVLGVMASSLWMIVVWIGRRKLTGHALPAARRGLLRVPAALTFVGIGLSLMMILLMTLVSVQEKPANSPASNPANAGSAEGTDPANESPDDKAATDQSTAAEKPSDAQEQTSPAETPAGATNPESTATAEDSSKKKSAASQMSPEEMRNALIQTVVMDAFLFLVFGLVVYVSRQQGRVYLTESATPVPTSQAGAFQAALYSSANFWPDLDDPAATPTLPGLALPFEKSTLTATDSSLSRPSAEANSSFAAPQTVNDETSLVASDSPAESLIEPDEPFSFLTELRYAAEVFLAAYVPTAVLRVFIVVLIQGLTGEIPEQHPFLEMMESDVGISVLSLIVLTAVILAPIVEELQFRVVILGGIAQLGRPWLALGVSSVLFAFAHGFPDSLALLPLAFALGYTYMRRRSYVTVMMVHFLFNAFNMALAFASMF